MAGAADLAVPYLIIALLFAFAGGFDLEAKGSSFSAGS